MNTSDMKRVAQARNYYRGDTNITPCSFVLSLQFTALFSVSVILKFVSLLTDKETKSRVTLRPCLLWVRNYIPSHVSLQPCYRCQ